jgi:betaine reductase
VTDRDTVFNPVRRQRTVAIQLAGKRIIAIGERDGVQGTALSACARAAGATVILEQTHCFV